MNINSKEKLVITVNNELKRVKQDYGIVNGQLVFKQAPESNAKITVIKKVEEKINKL
jgi:hypothetical protein